MHLLLLWNHMSARVYTVAWEIGRATYGRHGVLKIMSSSPNNPLCPSLKCDSVCKSETPFRAEFLVNVTDNYFTTPFWFLLTQSTKIISDLCRTQWN